MYTCISILLLSFNYVAMLNSFLFLDLQITPPQVGRRILRQVYKHKLWDFVHRLYLLPSLILLLDCPLVTVQDVNPLRAAADHTFNLSKGSIWQKQVLPQDELNLGFQPYNNLPTTEPRKQTYQIESVKFPALDSLASVNVNRGTVENVFEIWPCSPQL